MKTCNGCGKEFPLADFATRSAKCRPCHRDYTREHYKNNKQYYVDKAAKSNTATREKIRAAKDKPCADCGESFPYYVMHFDHLGDKEFDVSRGHQKSWAKIEAEIAKCEVVCANCHAIRTHKRLKGEL